MQKIRYAIAVGAAVLMAAPSAQAQLRRTSTSYPTSQTIPAGLCQVWIEGLPANRQPAPTDCDTARANAPRNARIIYGGNGSGTVNGRYDPRLDPRSPQYDPRYDPRDGRYGGQVYPGQRGRGNGDWKAQKEREKWERKQQKERDKAWRKSREQDDDDQDEDDDRRGGNGWGQYGRDGQYGQRGRDGQHGAVNQSRVRFP